MAAPSPKLGRVLAALEPVRGPDRSGWYTALCPFHEDREHPNLRITEKGFSCLACGAKGGLGKLVQALGLPADRRQNDSRIVATYDYCDEDSKLLFQVVRKEPKSFPQRRPDGKGGWIWNLDGVRRVPYRLPELLAADLDETVFVPEGEKDVDRLRTVGLVATCNPEGAGKWRDEFSEYLRGRRIVVLVDNDEAGRNHVRQVALSTHSVASEVRTLELPGLPEKGDVSDWFDAGGTGEELRGLAGVAPTWSAEPRSIACDQLREIVVTGRRIREMSGDGWESLRADDGPQFFTYGGLVAEIRQDDEGRARIAHLSRAAMRGLLDRRANWNRITKEGVQPTSPPVSVVDDMLALPSDAPELRGIAHTPPVAPDGALVFEQGYQAATRLYYQPRGEPVPPVAERPDETDLQRARLLIGHEWLGDFPFQDDASRANAIGAALTLIVRDLIDGPTPLQAIDAPAPGTGKTFLARSLGIIATGVEPAVRGLPRSEDEMRKQITAVLSDGRPLVLLDNVRHRLASPNLAAVLTTTTWADRLLGTPHNVELPVRTLFVLTGNNLDLDLEIARRTAWTRLDAMMDRPWERNVFKHTDFIGWVTRHRHELVWALLVFVRHWFAVGKPQWTGSPLGSFEAWSAIIGGMLEAAGVEGFLENRESLYRAADAETEEWRAFIAWWWETFGSRPVRSAELLSGAQQYAPSTFDRMRDDAKDRTLTTRLGKELRARRDRRFGDHSLRNTGEDGHTKTQLWRLEEAAEEDELAGVRNKVGRSPADPPQENDPSADSVAGDAVVAGDDSRPREELSVAAQANSESVRAPITPPHYPQPPQAASETGTDGAGAERGTRAKEPCAGGCGKLVPAGQKCAPCADAAVCEWRTSNPPKNRRSRR